MRNGITFSRKNFTLIEIIVILAIIAILASLVFPNIGDVKYQSFQAKIGSNIRSLQTVVDTYTLEKNGHTPTYSQPTLRSPQLIDFSLLFPKYVKNLPPKTEMYWVDITGKVWGSTIDAPYDVVEENGAIKWTNNSNVAGYKLYQIIEKGSKVSGSANKKTIILKEVAAYSNIANSSVVQFNKKNPNEMYLISSIDKYGYPTAPVGFGYYGAITPITITDPNMAERTLYITTKSKVKAQWIAIEKEEYKPEGTDITYEFATSDDGKNYTEFTSDFNSLNNSHYLKVKVTLTRTGKESPILYKLKVIYKPENEEAIYSSPLYESEDVIDLRQDKNPAMDSVTEAVRPIPTLEQGSIGNMINNGIGGSYPNGTISVPANTNGKVVLTVDLGENTYIGSVVPVISKSYGTNVKISYTTSKNGSNWSNSSAIPNTLPSGRYLRIEIDISDNTDGVIIEPFIINKTPKMPEVLDLENAPPYEEDGEPKPERNLEWIEIDRFEVWQDANEVVDWTSVEVDATIPENTRVRCVMHTSDDGSSWSIGTEDIEKVANSRFLKIVVISERKAEVESTAYPEIREVLINFDTSEGEERQSSYHPSKPVAVISSPYKVIDARHDIEWSYEGSTDGNNSRIVKAEWKIDGERYTNLPKKLSLGQHTIELRVQNANGIWSNWTSKTVTVREGNQAPVARINVSPSLEGYTNTQFTFTSGSTDPDGDEIIDTQWENVRTTYPVGTHTIRLRVKDVAGVWSEWTEVTITVTQKEEYQPVEVPYEYKSGEINLATTCDDCVYSVSLPFSFKFYDKTFKSLYLNNNGMLSFVTSTKAWSNTPLSNDAAPDYSIMVFWDDLDYRAQGGIYYSYGGSAPNRYATFEFRSPNHYSKKGNGVTFSVVLYENGTIEMNYKDVSFGLSEFDDGASATVGIKKDSTTYEEYSYNTKGKIYSKLTLRFNP